MSHTHHRRHRSHSRSSRPAVEVIHGFPSPQIAFPQSDTAVPYAYGFPSPGGFLMPSPSLTASPLPPPASDTRALALDTHAASRPRRHSHHTHTHHSHSHSHSPHPSAPQYVVAAPAPAPAARPHLPPIGMQQCELPSLSRGLQKKQRHTYQYSQCNGRKKAICIGINYRGSSQALHGCVNDAKNVRDFLIRQYGYKAQDIVLLSDDARQARDVPTRKNIIDAMNWLVKDARPHDSLFFHYSGHGGQVKDLDGDEDDGYDEVIYPIDYRKHGNISDDEMHVIMVKPLPAGCRLTAIFDSCHSGSALDLPYMYSTGGKVKEPNLVAEAGLGVLGAASSYRRGDLDGVIDAFGNVLRVSSGGRRAERYTRATRTSPADAIMWSGCKDSQTSADTYQGGEATGAMSFAFISSLTRNPQQTYQELLKSIRDILRRRYSQKPQLSSSHPIDTNILFFA